jgi:hypothetical protein
VLAKQLKRSTIVTTSGMRSGYVRVMQATALTLPSSVVGHQHQ